MKIVTGSTQYASPQFSPIVVVRHGQQCRDNPHVAAIGGCVRPSGKDNAIRNIGSVGPPNQRRKRVGLVLRVDRIGCASRADDQEGAQ
ncbi:hypothetical protein WK54_28225 [Burkholderia ubonensis]|nr:hypothetical protein WK54_28225 [Burkholderia ubonensis]